jgi:5-hydroxyisourate hydrolase-like protein (transthyretin family)
LVIAALVTLALSGTAAVVAGLPAATAASLIATRLIVSVSPHLVTYPIGQLAVTGTLETLVANGQPAQPVPGETVTLTLVSGGSQASLGSFVTDANGQFSTTASALSPGAVQGQFAGDATYRAAAGGAAFLAASQLPTRVSVEKIQPVPFRSNATVTAQVTMQLADGTWVPAPGSPVQVDNCAASSQSGWTDGNGQWATTIQAIPPAPGNGECSFFTGGSTGDSWTQWMLSPGFVVPLTTFPTQVASFYPVTGNQALPLGDIQFTGTAQWVDSAGQPHPYGGKTVQLYFSYGGKGTPQLMATAVTAKSGAITFPRLSGYLSGGRLAAGAWEARLPANGSYLAGDSGYYAGGLAIPVSFSTVKITGTGSTRHLTGALYLLKGRPLHGVRVTLLADVNGKLRHGPTVTTSAKGTFSIPLTAPTHPAQVQYAASFAGLTGNGVPAWIGPDGWVLLNQAVSTWLTWP